MAGEPFFLQVDGGQRFCLFHPPPVGACPGAVVYVHPFAEEMNKSRRMAALQSRALAAAGWAVLRIDLAGCGDSSGDFGDADWATWVADVRTAATWLRQRVTAPLWLWGLRAGCLVAAEAAQGIGGPLNLLFWQPVVSGKQHLQQFLRLKMAGELMGGDAKGAAEQLRQQMARRETVEIAGYALSPGLAAGLEAADLRPPLVAGRVVWLEVASRKGAGLSPASAHRSDEWRVAGWSVGAAVVSGPSFWQTVDIEEAPDLVAAVLQAVAGDGNGL